MAENVYDVLRDQNPALMEKLAKNEELCTFLQLVFSHLIVMASDSPEDPRRIVCDVTVELERLLKITVRWDRSISLEGVIRQGTSKVFWQRNYELVGLLKVNENVQGLATRVLIVIERWMDEKPYRRETGFENLRFENSMLWKNGVFTTEIVLKPEFDYDVIKAMGWDKEPEQPTEEERRIILP